MAVNDMKLGIAFDYDKCYTDLIVEILIAVESAITQMKEEMASISGSNTISNDWVGQLLDFSTEQIIAVVGNTHWWAFIDNFGSGSEMVLDTNKNPWLIDYLNSKYFNEERLDRGMAVVSRPEGKEYDSPDYRSGDGEKSPRPEGHGIRDDNGDYANLEETTRKNGRPYYTPNEPKGWYEKVMNKAELTVDRAINQAISKFNFYNYVRGVK
jgi:hypothetical protein